MLKKESKNHSRKIPRERLILAAIYILFLLIFSYLIIRTQKPVETRFDLYEAVLRYSIFSDHQNLFICFIKLLGLNSLLSLIFYAISRIAFGIFGIYYWMLISYKTASYYGMLMLEAIKTGIVHEPLFYFPFYLLPIILLAWICITASKRSSNDFLMILKRPLLKADSSFLDFLSALFVVSAIQTVGVMLSPSIML